MNKRKIILNIIKFLQENEYYSKDRVVESTKQYEQINGLMVEDALTKKTRDFQIQRLIKAYKIEDLIESIGLSDWKMMDEGKISVNAFRWGQ